MERPDSFASRAFSLGLLLAAIAVTVYAFALGGTPNWVAVVILALLLVLGDRVEIDLPSGISMTPIFMLVTAAVVVFVSAGAPAGALVVCLASQILDPHWWRNRKWAKLAFNAGMFTLCAAATVAFVSMLPLAYLDRPLGLALVGLISTVVLISGNVIFVAAADFLADGRKPHDLLAESGPFVGLELPFIMVGAFIGSLYVHAGPILVPLVVVPILITRQALVSYMTLKDTQEAATNTLIRALEAKDEYTAGHVERVAVYAEYIGQEFAFTPWRLERLRLAALMHDIGKLIVPNELLNKPGRLTEDEFEVVKKHEAVSIELLQAIDFLAPVAPSASSDYTDYRPDDPRHPIEPYIVHVADAYDAMTSTRSYRKALSQGVAFAELRDKSGTQFHPEVVEALIKAITDREEVHGEGHEEDQHLWAVAPPEAGTGSAGLGDLASEDGS